MWYFQPSIDQEIFEQQGEEEMFLESNRGITINTCDVDFQPITDYETFNNKVKHEMKQKCTF